MRVSPALAAALAPALALAACGGGDQQAEQQRNRPTAQQQAAQPSGTAAGVTPMAERVAVLGLLNKRNGIVRNLTMKPGQSVRVKDAIVRLRACETSAPWESEKLTGAFVQLDVQRSDESWGRVFSGWLYKETPSLNVVEHPVYDVWVKSCAMTFPGEEESPDASPSNAPNAKGKSSPAPSPSPSPPPSPLPTPA